MLDSALSELAAPEEHWSLELAHGMEHRLHALEARQNALVLAQQALAIYQPALSEFQKSLLNIRRNVKELNEIRQQALIKQISIHEPKGAAERRAHARVPIFAKVELESETNLYTGFSMDLSEAACLWKPRTIFPKDPS